MISSTHFCVLPRKTIFRRIEKMLLKGIGIGMRNIWISGLNKCGWSFWVDPAWSAIRSQRYERSPRGWRELIARRTFFGLVYWVRSIGELWKTFTIHARVVFKLKGFRRNIARNKAVWLQFGAICEGKNQHCDCNDIKEYFSQFSDPQNIFPVYIDRCWVKSRLDYALKYLIYFIRNKKVSQLFL